MITVVKLGNDGQSVLELMFTIPVFIGFIWIFFQVNSAIQVSINNQQHARAQAFHLTFNSPIFPELKFRVLENGMQNNGAPDQFVAGTSADVVDDTNPGQVSATVVSLARDKNKVRGESIQSVPAPGAERTNVRIRDTVTLCTQRNPTSDATTNGGYCR